MLFRSAAPNLHASVHVKLFEDVTNHDQLRATKAPPPAHRALAELERQQRLQQAVLRQRANPAVPRYAQPLGVRPQTAPSGRPTLLRGPPGATGYAAVSRPSQRVGGERAYLPVTKAPNKAPTDSYALSPHKANPRLGEVEKEMLHRQALLRRLMREPRHAAHGVARPQSRPQSAHPQSRPQSAHPQSRPQSAHPQSRPPSAPCSSRPAYVGSPDMYRHERTLGKGAFGLVSLVRSVLTGELVAMKTIDRSKLYTQNLKKTVEHEIRILKLLRHQSVISLYEIIETPRAIHLIMEYSDGGNLHEHTKRHKRMAEPMAQRLFLQLLDAVAHCHAMRVCHRDLKLENFVLDKTQIGRASCRERV